MAFRDGNVPFKRFVKAAGGPGAAAEMLGVSLASIASYRLGRRAVPLALAKVVEEFMGGEVTRMDVLYPEDWRSTRQ